jgi:hypothetical protein
MTVAPGLRKFALTLHIVASVGWIGMVAGFLALAVAGLVSPDANLVLASYLAMDLSYRTVVIPLGLASVVTGLVSSFMTDWGLLRHYWVVVKLLLTTPAIILMLVHIQPVRRAARAAAATILSGADLFGLRLQLVADASAALIVLLVATALSTYKPRGRIRRGAARPNACP